jgi:hypothetical protein
MARTHRTDGCLNHGPTKPLRSSPPALRDSLRDHNRHAVSWAQEQRPHPLIKGIQIETPTCRQCVQLDVGRMASQPR